MTTKKALTGVIRGRYYEAFKEGRGRNAEIVVKVWATDKKEGEPKDEWGMPAVLGFGASIDQAVLQSL